MKNLSLPLTDKQYDLFSRIAKYEDRKVTDLFRLIVSEGLNYYWSERSIWLDKKPDEFSEEEKKQKIKNEKIEKDLEKENKKWHQLTTEELKKIGYKRIEDQWRGGGYTGGEADDVIEKLSNEIKRPCWEEVAK